MWKIAESRRLVADARRIVADGDDNVVTQQWVVCTRHVDYLNSGGLGVDRSRKRGLVGDISISTSVNVGLKRCGTKMVLDEQS